MSDDVWDYEDGPEWADTEEDYKCEDCGHVGPADAEVACEIQGDGVMTGVINIATGNYRCKECGSSELEELDATPGAPTPPPEEQK